MSYLECPSCGGYQEHDKDCLAGLRCENADLRAQVKKLQRELDDERKKGELYTLEWDLALEKAEARAQALEAERDELQATFDLQQDADQRAVKRWQQAHKEHVWPDRADLVVWLMEQHAKLQAENVALREGLQNARKLLIDEGDPDEDRDWVFEIDQLLASPNPGAKVQAAIDAMRQIAEAHEGDHAGPCPCFLCEAVRALDAKENSDAK